MVSQGKANKRLGADAETRCKRELEKNGYLVWKSARSLTVADLIAAKPGEWLLVQVKGGAKIMTHDDWNQLYKIGVMLSAGGHGGAYSLVHAILADWPYRTTTRWGQMRLSRITGYHVAATHTWPTEPFSIDEPGDAP